MASTSKANRTATQTQEPSTVDGEVLDNLDVTDPDAQQLVVPDGEESYVETKTMELTQAAAKRAADWVSTKGYGPNMAKVIQFIAANAVDTSELNAVIMEQLAIRILNATSAEDVYDPFGTVAGKDIIGKAITVDSVTYLEGDKNEGFPWYVSLMVRNPQTGGHDPVIVGGEKLVPQVAGIDMHGGWPVVIQIGANKTRAGNDVYELVKPGSGPGY